MTPDQRLQNILLASKLGPLTPYYGVVDGSCECGRPKTKRHKPGKHPHGSDSAWQSKASGDHRAIRQWLRQHPDANYAVVAGIETVVLDLDIRPGKNGVQELVELELAAGQQIPATVTVLSGSGSGAKHLYFKIPSDLEQLQKPKGTKGIDFLRSRQGVIVPGSLHESGNFYEFAPGLSPDDVEVAELPVWLKDLMRKPTISHHRSAGTEIIDDIEELFDELLKMGPPPGSVSPGRRRDDKTVKRKMKTVPMRMYGDDRSHSDSHWAWTLARNTCHHWDQYLRIWKDSEIRFLPDTKCGRASYEANLLIKAFVDQGQQWKNRKSGPVEKAANPALAKHIRSLSKHTETPKSPLVLAVLRLNYERPDLSDSEIAEGVNASPPSGRQVNRDYVKHIRHRYRHLWRS